MTKTFDTSKTYTTSKTYNRVMMTTTHVPTLPTLPTSATGDEIGGGGSCDFLSRKKKKEEGSYNSVDVGRYVIMCSVSVGFIWEV